MNERNAREYRRLVDIGDRVLEEIEKADANCELARAVQLRLEAKRIDNAIAAVKDESVKDEELAVLKEKADESENDLDAYLAALRRVLRELPLRLVPMLGSRTLG